MTSNEQPVPEQIQGSSLVEEEKQPAQIQEEPVDWDKLYPSGLPYVPIPYSEGQPVTHLDIGNLVEESKEMKEKANFFVCPICANIVLDAIECNGCNSLFCTGCIEPWRRNNQPCPKKCQGNEDVGCTPVNRYVKDDLMRLKFKCKNQTCTQVLPY